MATVTLEGVTRRWGSVVGVDNQSLHVRDHELLVLVGPSGCGKTTTMRMIAGLEDVSSGEIRIDGQVVNDVEPKNRDIAMVFQSYALYPHLSVSDNIGFPLKLRKVPTGEIKRRVAEVAKKVDLEHLLDRRPKELSGGQRQRVALARAIVRTPRVFLMDEPLSNLDAKLRTSMRVELKHLHHELATTTIYVTHDQIEALTLGDRIAVMNAGVIQQLGTPEEIYTNPRNLFVAGFIGSPPMNFLAGTLNQGAFNAPGVSIHGAADLRDGSVVLGVRPEDLMLTAGEPFDLEGSVFACELIGDSVLLTMEISGQRVSAKCDKSTRISVGELARMSVDRKNMHFFDPDTGFRLVAD